ncbi:hypothetical protein KF707_06865 [Candidatus Obscuribacterales bacterium]|nr:hypothetical protein [Candidatus Obscuribacterales bacterium]
MKRLYFAVIIITLLLMDAKSSWAALTAGQLTGVLVSANVGKKTTEPKAVGTGPVVTVLAQGKPDATDNDLKIDAVFYAKTLIEAAPEQVSSVKVLYSQSGRTARFVSVSKSVIDDFGAGKKSPSELLGSLTLIPVQEEAAPNVVPGAEMERRLLIWKRIEKLRQRGTGVKPFEALFAQIETLSKAGSSSDLTQKISYLETKLTEQEEQVKQAKQAASGHRLILKSGGNSAGVQAGGPIGGPNGGRQTNTANAPMNLPGPGTGNDFAVPPNVDHILQSYSAGAPLVINRVSGNDAQQLRQLKQQIDALIAANKRGQACAMIAQFHSLSMKLTGVDIMAPGGGGGPP